MIRNWKTILVTLDLTDEDRDREAIETAIELCGVSGAKLQVLTVVPDAGSSLVGSFFPENYEELAVEETSKRLDSLISRTVPGEVLCTALVRIGTVYVEIIKAIKELECDLVVMHSHRPNLKDYLLGPNAARVVRHAPCSVHVVR